MLQGIAENNRAINQISGASELGVIPIKAESKTERTRKETVKKSSTKTTVILGDCAL